MKTPFLLSLYIFLVSASCVNAQVDPVGEFNRHIAESWKGNYTRIGPYNVKGSPFLLGESFPGIITYKGGKTLSNTKVLYDLYNQKAGVDANNQIWENDVPVESFTITLPEKFGGKQLLFKSGYLFNKPELKGYLNVLEDGKKVAFMKVYKSKLVPDPSNEMAKDTKIFEQYYDYYVYNKEARTLSNIKLRKKDLSKVLSDDFVKTYLANHDNSPDLSSEANVKSLIRGFNLQ